MEEQVISGLLSRINEQSREKGLLYAKAGKVSDMVLSGSPPKRLLSSKVAGSLPHPYKVEITIDLTQKRALGICSCPTGFNCKHVVAVVYQFLGKTKDPMTAHKTANTLPPSPPLKAAPPPIPQPKIAPPATPQIPGNIKSWISSLESADQTSANKTPSSSPRKQQRDIRYVLNSNLYTQSLYLEGYEVRYLLNGSIAKGYPRRIGLSSVLIQSGNSDLMKDEDWEIAKLMVQSGVSGNSVNFSSFSHAFEVLKLIVETGRCYTDLHGGFPLKWGETLQGRFEWVFDDRNHTQQLKPMNGNQNHKFVMINDHVIYIDPIQHQLGALQFQEAPKLVKVLLNAPPITPEASHIIQDVFVKKSPLTHLAPKEIQQQDLTVKPTPKLKVFVSTWDAEFDDEDYWWEDEFYGDVDDEVSYLTAELYFDYAGHLCQYSRENQEQSTSFRTSEAIVTVHRDENLEKQAAQQLVDLGWEPEESSCFVIENEDIEAVLIEFLKTDLPVLEQQGWRVELDNSFPVHRLMRAEEFYVDVDNSKSSNNWFDVELGALIGDQRVNLLPFLKLILNDAKQLAHYLNDLAKTPPGTNVSLINDKKEMVVLPAEKILHFLTIFNADTLDSNGEKFTLPQWNMAMLQEMSAAENAANMRWFGSDSARKIADILLNPSYDVKLTFPEQFRCQLRPYQEAGVAWMQRLRASGMNGVLADDMGLGKTVQAIAHLTLEKEQGRLQHPSLLIAPTTLMPNWMAEVEKFAPHLKILVLHGNNRKQHFEALKNYDLIFTTYSLLAFDKEVLLEQQFYYLILDEAQYVKNSKTLTYQIVQQVNAQHRLLLTGTPMENHLGEIWSLFHLLMPGLLGVEKTFNKLFKLPIEKDGDKARQKMLAKRLKPFLMRRTKDLVAQDLPDKTIIVQHVEFSSKQRDLYESIRLKAQERVMSEIAEKGFNRSQIVVLDALLKLRQACCDPRLVKLDTDLSAIPSAKLDYLREMLPQMVEEGKQIILFSQFTSMLALIQQELQSLGIGHEILTGDTTDRKTPVERFQNKEIPIILLSLKAGGVGLNLTTADTVIHFDPWWNPAAESQATDRAHRIGQKNALFVYKLVAKGTVEEKILLLQDKKRQLLEAIIDAKEGDASKLTLEDIEDIFKPLSVN